MMQKIITCDLSDCGYNEDGKCTQTHIVLIEATHYLLQCASSDIELD
jgi:hypothetical protein